MNFEFEDNQIVSQTAYNQVEASTYPESEFPENARKLKGFIWRGDERIKSKDDIFPEEENILHEKILMESKKKSIEEDTPMETLKETLEYDKKNPKPKENKKK